MQHNIFATMRSLKIMEGCRSSQIYPFNLSHDQDRTKSIRKSQIPEANAVDFVADCLLPYGLPKSDQVEPQIEPSLRPVDFVETLADIYRRIEDCHDSEKSNLYMEQSALFRVFPDPKFVRQSLRSARQHAIDVHSKIVLASWLRYERRDDELIGSSSMYCFGQNIECPVANLVAGYDPQSVYEPCMCCREPRDQDADDARIMDDEECLTSEEDDEDGDMSFIIGDTEIRCRRFDISLLSTPFKTMLYGGFMESKREKINFSHNEISAEAMMAAEVYSRTKRLTQFPPKIVLELLSFANKFCCEEMKAACDVHLASLVGDDMEEAMLLIEYGLEEMAHILVAACLQVLLRELPSSMHSPSVVKLFCNSEGRDRLAMTGHASFLLYYFLSHVAMEEEMKSNTTVMLLERLGEIAVEGWQKQLALHQLGVVMLERREYKDAQCWFEAAAGAGHIYSLVGAARGKYKRGHKYAAFKMVNSLISDCKPVGWMYQERSLYCSGREKLMDLISATELDPTLSFPYKYRAVTLLEENKIEAAISEINKIISFMVSPDCLELRAWFLIALKDYEGALRDVQAILTLDPNYMMFFGKMPADELIPLLHPVVQQWNQAECWIQLYDRWSAVDDIGSLAVVHHMLEHDPGKSLLRFRQSLLLLRLNCPKAAMRSLRLARNHSHSEHERLVYEGWVLYDTGLPEEALAKAEQSISIQRSFEAFFLKAYILADSSKLDDETAKYVIHLLEDALSCPSDGLRKGQALNNLGSIYIDCDKLDNAADCYMNALNIKHTRAHQGLARVYHLKHRRKDAYNEMTKLIEKAQNNASAYEKRAEYCDREMAEGDLCMATELDPLRTYPYRYRAAALMDDHKEAEAIAELTKAIRFKPDVQLLLLRAAFYESMNDYHSTIRDCEAALCLDPSNAELIDFRDRAKGQITEKMLGD